MRVEFGFKSRIRQGGKKVVYNECLIVVWSKVTVAEKKGPSLVYWFQRSMESGDASDEEAPPCDPKSNNLTKKRVVKGNFHGC